MKDLSPLAQQLVKAGKNAGVPTDADKERIREALQQRLAAPPELPGDTSGPALQAAQGAPWALIAGVTVFAGVLSGILWWRSARPAAAPPVDTPVAASQNAPGLEGATAPDSENDRVPAPAPVVVPAPRVEPAAPAPAAQVSSEARPKNRLAEEVALLSRATRALHAGRAREALTALAEHQQRFPRGLLSVERAAARAQALCQLGRKAEAERELGRLSPTSPEAARARRACGHE